MIKRIRKEFRRYMIRPLIYKLFTRFMLTLCAGLLWHRFVPMERTGLNLSGVMTIIAAVYVLCTWLAYLRLKGTRVPRINLKLRRHRDPVRLYGDMSDYTDQEIYAFEELEESEQDLCVFLADGILALLFGVISLFV